ncbi:AP-1 complex subunit sigma-2 [Cinnamomum micranthum f. kanehirae]|uniref:AP-1 complex subunit sigma-2 n=1 Tax=Cinnamomum micranthum f. kanehirae TaxID=337451 RepID=A0A443N466_9MAGN|nr:AP-1 complex subunit sigma-2 [Cinnamomum micranthum f. kanehirae]
MIEADNWSGDIGWSQPDAWLDFQILTLEFGTYVCELDLIFNFHKADYILDELLIAGELQESSKKTVARLIAAHSLNCITYDLGNGLPLLQLVVDLCAAPGSKGTKILVCYSSNSPQPSRMESHKYSSEGQNRYLLSEIEQIIMKEKSYSDRLLSDILDVPFLHDSSPVTKLGLEGIIVHSFLLPKHGMR